MAEHPFHRGTRVHVTDFWNRECDAIVQHHREPNPGYAYSLITLPEGSRPNACAWFFESEVEFVSDDLEAGAAIIAKYAEDLAEAVRTRDPALFGRPWSNHGPGAA